MSAFSAARGLAWSPGSGWVVRGGYGIFWVWLLWNHDPALESIDRGHLLPTRLRAQEGRVFGISEWVPVGPPTSWKLAADRAGLRRVAQGRKKDFRKRTFPCRIVSSRWRAARTCADAPAVAISLAQVRSRQCVESHFRIKTQGYDHIPAFSKTRHPLAYRQMLENGRLGRRSKVATPEFLLRRLAAQRNYNSTLPRPGISMDGALGTFDVENVLKEEMHGQREETRFRGVRGSP